jgi:hypothetical protein
MMLGVILFFLGAAWVAIDVNHNLRIAIFQPFRMATVARGLALVLIAGRLVELWERGGWLARIRSVLIAVALVGDWLLVVVTITELAVSLCEWFVERVRQDRLPFAGRMTSVVFAAFTAYGVFFLSRHDTESGHWPLLAVLGVALVVISLAGKVLSPDRLRFKGEMWSLPAQRWALIAAWLIPVAALIAGLVPADHAAARWPLVHGLVARCRFAATPIDDIERLAVWCKQHTPKNARFIGPPGPKTFRLWSQRSLAFNRAGSPYHAAGLADWFTRFQDHVNVHEPPAAFVRDYLANRHRFEARYDRLSQEERAALAFRHGADHVIAHVPSVHHENGDSNENSPMELLHAEGRYAVYRIKPELLSQRQR